MDDFSYKQQCLKGLLSERKLDAILLTRVSSFAWATCGGASYVGLTTSDGVASLLITSNERYLLTNNIEAQRLEQEEVLAAQGWKFIVEHWYATGKSLTRLIKDLRAGSDNSIPGMEDLSVSMTRLRNRLTEKEGELFRQLGKLCAQAFETVMRTIEPGQTERQIAACLSKETELRGVQPVAIMVAADERIFSYRHPLPTNKILKNYIMVILCGRKNGLICSMSRLIHFGKLSTELKDKMNAVAQIDAAIIANTRPGKMIGDVFSIAVQAYANAGWPDEWQSHHQGGSAGYEPREFVAIPGMKESILNGQVYAWNPSIKGVKSEDTILVGKEGNEILTEMPVWPKLRIDFDGHVYLRPAIMEI